jgi:hypothetical protein
MALTRCCVSFADTEGIIHCAHVQAESLYEAVALAVADFREDPLVPSPSSATQFSVTIEKPPVERRIYLSQVSKWAESTTKEGLAGLIKRQSKRSDLRHLSFSLSVPPLLSCEP